MDIQVELVVVVWTETHLQDLLQDYNPIIDRSKRVSKINNVRQRWVEQAVNDVMWSPGIQKTAECKNNIFWSIIKLQLSNSTSSDVRVDLTALKTPPPRLEGPSYLYIVYIPGKTSEFEISINTKARKYQYSDSVYRF